MDEQTHAKPQESEAASTETGKKEETIDFGTGEKNTLMAILAYIGPLVIVSYLVAEKDPFVKFHIKQGLLLFIGEVAAWMIAMMFWPLFPLTQVANIFLFVLAIVGIVRAAQDEMKELPLIGHLAKNFDF